MLHLPSLVVLGFPKGFILYIMSRATPPVALRFCVEYADYFIANPSLLLEKLGLTPFSVHLNI